jgi:hypothetical protein
MSTWSSIQGTVKLDPAAAQAFAATQSWEWCNPECPESGVEPIVERDGSLVLEFDGSSFRNLTRYLHGNLAQAQQQGEVVGMITDDCVDGDNSRVITRYDGHANLTGFSKCLDGVVMASPGMVDPLGGDTAFLKNAARVHQTDDSPYDGPVVELQGPPTVEWCTCERCQDGEYLDLGVVGIEDPDLSDQ